MRSFVDALHSFRQEGKGEQHSGDEIRAQKGHSYLHNLSHVLRIDSGITDSGEVVHVSTECGKVFHAELIHVLVSTRAGDDFQ